MPFYDLKCSCGTEFNVRASIAQREEKQIVCPQCGGRNLQTVFKAMQFSVKKPQKTEDCAMGHQCCGGCKH